MAQTFKLSMPAKYKRLYPPGLVAAAIIIFIAYAVEGWQMTSTVWVICMFALPFALLFLYSLFLNPWRTKIILDDEFILVKAPPFYKGKIFYKDINKASIINLDSEHPLSLFVPRMVEERGIKRFKGEPPRTKKKRIKLGQYRVGIFTLKNERVGLVMANRLDVLCVETPDKYFLLAPDNFQIFVDTIKANVTRVRRELRERTKAEKEDQAATSPYNDEARRMASLEQQDGDRTEDAPDRPAPADVAASDQNK